MKKIGCGTIIAIIVLVAIIGSFFKVDINDEEKVIKDMQGTWVGTVLLKQMTNPPWHLSKMKQVLLH
ncbi:MAG: hypothetical protein MUO72_11245 [Bacteroidales bacterium]|nr:hypothetical protein [Bacteroidales bacterium]